MRIGLIDVDGHHFPNLALMRISAYHKARGDTVEWWWSDFVHYDIVYMSKIFSDAYSPDVPEPLNADKVIKGGTGYCITLGSDGKEHFDKSKNTPLPPEMEHCFPDYSIYPQFDFAVSMTSRGCPRGCSFCHVAANVAANAFASSPQWWIDGNMNNGASEKAGKAFFRSDYSFNIINFFDFCARLLRKEPKERGQAPCMIVFCAFQQITTVIENAERKGFKHYQQIVFIKNYSPQVLKANMRLCGATEYALLLYRDKLPKFNSSTTVDRCFSIGSCGRETRKTFPNSTRHKSP